MTKRLHENQPSCDVSDELGNIMATQTNCGVAGYREQLPAAWKSTLAQTSGCSLDYIEENQTNRGQAG